MLKKNSFSFYLVYAIETALILLCVFLALHKQDYFGLSWEGLEQFLPVAPWLVLVYVCINHLFDRHIYYKQTIFNIILTTVVGQFIFSILLCLICTVAIEPFFFDIGFVLPYLMIATLVSSLIHLGVFAYVTKKMASKRVMIVGQAEVAQAVLENIKRSTPSLHQATHMVIGNYLENIKASMDEVDVVLLADLANPALTQEIYHYLLGKDKTVYLTATVDHSFAINSQLLYISDESLIELSPYSLTAKQAFFKRVLDILISATLLCLLSPIILLTALAIKLESKGPVFYKQDRITLGNKVFQILKFRSMVNNAEERTGPVLAKKNDSRVTRVGRFIRTTRIDEIPQFINVLKGEMSIIGPRPERPNFVEEFSATNPFYSLRHNVRAGITGYAQVYGTYTSNFESKLKFDLLYIKGYSFYLDIKLLLNTILIVFNKLSAQGESSETQDETDVFMDNSVIILR
ncbi:TPA: sugar transferase [Streptococcus suis]